MSSPLSLHTSRPVRKATRTYTHAHTCANKHHPALTHTSTRTHTHPTNTDTNNLSVYVLSCTDKHPPTQEAGEECPWCKLACVCAKATCQKKSTSSMINERVCVPPSHQPLPLLYIPLFSPSSGNSKYLSGGLPRVYAVLDVSNPGVFLQRVDGFQDVLSPVFHLWKQPNTVITH